MFGGLFVNESNVPGPLKWLPAASLVKQAFEGACINEFKGAAGLGRSRVVMCCARPGSQRPCQPVPSNRVAGTTHLLVPTGVPRYPFTNWCAHHPLPPGAEFELDERGGGTATGEQVLDRLSFGPPASIRKTLAAQGRCADGCARSWALV